MEKDGGGWTVFQRRGDYGNLHDYFYRNWTNYSQGFGKLNERFWLGLDKIHSLTAQGNYMLRINMVKFRESGDYYAVYSNFKVGSKDELYKLTFDNFVEGNIGDSLSIVKNNRFSTFDNGPWIGVCSDNKNGGWWVTSTESCYTHLSVNNKNINYKCTGGMIWHIYGEYIQVEWVEMKIRRME
ncbi:techylectin-5A-like [Centruroides sculpturatus]|uniref:techylectin-5A-like n=1 Tax=Centruroides sculpturatus TaxID=218467 RepID=UPI000C6D37D7|nr:techylectin-5A-like [Centruroides sculpturatus]